MSLSKRFLVLCGVVALLFGVVLAYAETRAFSWDEGFHLLADYLMKRGQRPYIDFCFPQTPLNAYWNSVWLRLFGDSWRMIHFIGSLLVSGAILLTGDFILRRFPVERWRLAGAIAAALLVGLNGAVVLFGPIAQAYGFCLVLSVAAFRLATIAVDRTAPWLAGLAGLSVSASAAGSLLTAPALPVMLLWLLFYNRAGNRFTKFVAFVVGAVVPFLPIAWLFIQAPHQVFFNLIEYHMRYRRVHWEGATEHDVDVWMSWINSGSALLLFLLAAGGLLFVAKRSGWERARRAEYYLCGWIALFMGTEIATAHPTFTWYFLLIVPFLAIPAAAGVYALASRLYSPDRVVWPVAVLTVLLGVAFARTLQDDAGSFTWHDMEAVANKVNEITPDKNAPIFSSEHIYFLTHRPIPDGMEFQPALKLEMPMSEA